MADNAEKDKKDNSFMMKLATLIVDKRKGFYLIFIVLCIFCVLSMNRVKVNNDLTTYLPDTTETRRGLDLMDSEFTTYGSARILICNVTFDEAQKLADQVEEMDGVSMLDFDDSSITVPWTKFPTMWWAVKNIGNWLIRPLWKAVFC